MLQVDLSRCTGCGSCVRSCPVDGAIAIVGGVATVDANRCAGCGVCIDACPNAALSLGAGALQVVRPAPYPSPVQAGEVEPHKRVSVLAKRVAALASGVAPFALDLALGAVDRWLARRSGMGYDIARRGAGGPGCGLGPRRGRRRGRWC